MSDLKVTGHVNGHELDFEARAPDGFEAETGRSPDGAYRAEIMAEDEYGNVSLARDTVYTDDAWIEPVWWRTDQDVRRAWYLNRKLSEGGGLAALTPDEQREWLSGLLGALNCHDLNRIEIDTRYLERVLYAYGYGLGGSEHKTDWKMGDFDWASELERMRSNIGHLLDVYHRVETDLPASLDRPDHITINHLERVLYELKDMLRRMEQSFRYSGTFCSGQEVEL